MNYCYAGLLSLYGSTGALLTVLLYSINPSLTILWIEIFVVIALLWSLFLVYMSGNEERVIAYTAVGGNARILRRFTRLSFIEKPQLCLISWLDGIAVGRNLRTGRYTIYLSGKILEKFSASNTVAALGHELGHIIAGDLPWGNIGRFLAALVCWNALPILFYGLLLTFVHPAPILFLFACGVACILILYSLLVFLLSSIIELRADAVGSLLSGKDHRIADALLTLYPRWTTVSSLADFFLDPSEWLMSRRVASLRSFFQE